ncbi:tRNA pseudouridine(38-40) synthase TruA [Luteolibacter yonseiensis]|nr:tRNA pseudouridine(38-40) synthase TruA [Luteolibacter yonseiensis]
MLRFKLIIAYDGAGYHGWQSRPEGTGVQNRVEAALARLFPSGPTVESASRTDSGVHALGMTAHFEVDDGEDAIPPAKLALAVNAFLPDDIRVRVVRPVREDFHARFDASGKQYRYHVWNGPVMNPLRRTQAWHVARELDLDAMREAAGRLLGRHDFRSFTTNRGVVLEDAVRTLTRCEIRKQGRLVTFIMEGEGFLYKMCRCIVGTLVQVGEGKFSTAEIASMLECRDRAAAGVNAPAHGLVLWKVFY